MNQQNHQRELLNEYLKLKNYPILKTISAETGIQLTRVHRLLKGAEMKLSEYLIFKEQVNELKGGVQEKFVQSAHQASHILPENKLQEFLMEFERMFHLRSVLNGQAS